MFARTERLLLRPSWPEDARVLYDAICDEGIVRNLALAPWPYTRSDADTFAAKEHDVHYPNFLLFRRTDGAPVLIGGCGIGGRNGHAELGYWIARPYWGLGYASEAVPAVMGIAAAIGHRHLTAGHYADNPASSNVLRKAGFRRTGKTEMRHSKGRGHAALSIMYQRELAGSTTADIPDMRRRILMPYDAQPIAA
jgi:RimJ/RimL family protein N-acetyltransferase